MSTASWFCLRQLLLIHTHRIIPARSLQRDPVAPITIYHIGNLGDKDHWCVRLWCCSAAATCRKSRKLQAPRRSRLTRLPTAVCLFVQVGPLCWPTCSLYRGHLPRCHRSGERGGRLLARRREPADAAAHLRHGVADGRAGGAASLKVPRRPVPRRDTSQK